MEKVCSRIEAHPNITEFDDGSKATSLQFIDEMVEFVRTLNELRLIGFDSELHFDDDRLSVENIDEDVSGSEVKFISNIDHFNQFWFYAINPHQFIV